jgi:hypothetical protein
VCDRTHGDTLPDVGDILGHRLEVSRGIVALGDVDVVLLAIGRGGVKWVNRDEPGGAVTSVEDIVGLHNSLDLLFLDRSEQLETGQEFSLGDRSLDDGRYDGDVEVGRAYVLCGRDAGNVDVCGVVPS